MLEEFNSGGFVEVQESEVGQKKAVAGVQWAMGKAFDSKVQTQLREPNKTLRGARIPYYPSPFWLPGTLYGYK